MYSKEQICVN